MSEIPDDCGVGVSGGVPVPFLWERDGRRVRFMFVGSPTNEDVITFGVPYESDGDV